MLQGLVGEGTGMKLPIPPRDLADFHLRWSDFRPAMIRLQKAPQLTPEQSDTLGWLIALSDRISDHDIGQ